MNSIVYRGWTITPRTFQIRGSGLWTLDLVIASRTTRRTFTDPTMFRSEPSAIRGCHTFGRRIIDGLVPSCSLKDMR